MTVFKKNMPTIAISVCVSMWVCVDFCIQYPTTPPAGFHQDNDTNVYPHSSKSDYGGELSRFWKHFDWLTGVALSFQYNRKDMSPTHEFTQSHRNAAMVLPSTVPADCCRFYWGLGWQC